MKKLLLVIGIYCCVIGTVYPQCDFRTKIVHVQQKGVDVPIEFLIPPHSKIAYQGFIFPKKQLTFEKGSRYRYHYIYIKGLSLDYSASVKAIKNATYKFNGSVIDDNDLQDRYSVQSTPYKIDSCIVYYRSVKDDNLLFRIDFDSVLKTANTFEQLEVGLYKALSELSIKLNQDGNWPPNITQELIEELYSDIPMPANCIADRYLALGAREKDFSFVLLSPKIWLNVDFVDKIQPLIPATNDLGEVLDKGDPKFWSFNMTGQSTIRFYRDNDGSIMQSAFLAPASNLGVPPNLVADKTTLQASSADVQLTKVLSNSSFIGLFQKSFKPNNSHEKPLNNVNAQNNFKLQNSQLLFFDKVDDELIESLNKSLSPQTKGNTVITSVFGLRNLITPVIPVFINNFIQPLLFQSTIGINESMGYLQEAKKMKMFRLYKGKYRAMKFFNNDTLLLPTDRFKF